MLTQRDRVMAALRRAGDAGVRSDHFFKLGMPRAAARIQELRDAGEPITSEREGKYVRYRLQEQCGVTSRSTNQHGESEANPPGASTWPSDRLEGTTRTGQDPEPGDESEVPATAPEDNGVGLGTGQGSDLHDAAPRSDGRSDWNKASADSGVEGSPANDNATTSLSALSESAGEPCAPLSLFETGESAYERMRDREAA